MSIDKAVAGEVRKLHSNRTAMMKAHVIGGDRDAGLAEQAIDEEEQAFTIRGALEAPYDPETLVALLEHSNSLRQNVDSYVVNVHSHGHHFEPIIDLNSDDSNTQIADLLFARQQRANPSADVPDPRTQAEMPTEEDVLAARKELEEQMRMEKGRLNAFFENASLEYSFEKLRMLAGMDKEVLGNGFWEIVRNEAGQIAQFNQIAGYTMRLMPLDQKTTSVKEKVRVDEVTWGTINVEKRFRRYAQVFETEAVYFKELGDPRVISHLSGRIFPTVEAMKTAEPQARMATEVLHFKIHNPRTAYGVPRWIGVLLSVLGSRQVDEVNYSYFENKSVPPLVFLVNGGRMTEESINRIRDHIDSEIRGKHNFHKVLVLEADSGDAPGNNEASGRARIDMKPLTVAQHNDALFQKYDERNLDKVGMSFRLPRMLRGDIRDFNRATADAALEFAEMQVFSPEREEFDFVMNRKILPTLGIRFWRFKSNSPKLTDPVEHGKMIGDLTKEGVLTPGEAREEAEKVLNRELRNIKADWTRQPISLTLAGIAPPAEALPPIEDGEEPEEVVEPDTTEIELTGTDLASIVTVNEVREQHGLGRLKLPDGKDDPEGDLTITEFKSKRMSAGMAAGQVVGRTEGQEEAGVAPTPPSAGEGEQTAAKTGSLVKLGHAALMQDATYLLRLRDAMTDAEEREALKDFEEAAEHEADSEE